MVDLFPAHTAPFPEIRYLGRIKRRGLSIREVHEVLLNNSGLRNQHQEQGPSPGLVRRKQCLGSARIRPRWRPHRRVQSCAGLGGECRARLKNLENNPRSPILLPQGVFLKQPRGTVKLLVKTVEYALNATFLAVHVISRVRTYLLSKPPGAQEETRLMAEWVEARNRRYSLQHELDYPSASRLHGGDSQLKLTNSLKLVQAKCGLSLVALRAHRRAKRD